MKEYKTKRAMIYDVLKQEIYDGVYKPGEKLTISKLAKRFGSSDIPVREAINQLQSDNLAIVKPHIGAFVAPLSLKDIKNIFEVRVEIEALATRLATNNMNKEEIEKLQHIIDESYKALERHDFDKLESLNIDFHMGIYRQSNNDILVQLIQDLWKNGNRYGSIFKKNDKHNILSLKEHEETIRYLQEKNALKAEEAMLKHTSRVMEEVLELIKKDIKQIEEKLK